MIEKKMLGLVVTLENATKVSEIVQQNLRKNIRRIASATGLKYTNMQKILKNNLLLSPYKIQSHQVIPVKTVQQRVDFANQSLTMIDNDGFDVSCTCFTDEVHFHLNGIVNKQN